MVSEPTQLARVGHSTTIGPLEWRIMEFVWAQPDAVSVRDITQAFPESKYSTISTTADRLYQKGLLSRTKRSRAFFYAAAMKRTQFEGTAAITAIKAVVENPEGEVISLLSALVGSISERDRALLDALDELLKAKRSELMETGQTADI
jgi:predicted transcriptional regulator